MGRGLRMIAVLSGILLTQNAFGQGRCAMSGGGPTGTGVIGTTGGIGTGITGTGVSPAAIYQMAMIQAYQQQQLMLQQQAYLQQQAATAQYLAAKKERKLAVLRERRARETAGWNSTKSIDRRSTPAAAASPYSLSQAGRSPGSAANLR